MKRLFYLVPAMLLALTLLAGAGSAQNEPVYKRRDLITKLRSDIDRAMANATLSEEQKKKLDESRAKLQQAAAKRHRGGERAKPREMHDALQDIRTVFESDAFKAEDRQAVRDDLKKLLEGRKGSRRRRAA